MRGCLRACMTVDRIQQWEHGGNRSRTMRFGMCLPMFERWFLNKMTAWAAGSDEIDALLDHVRAVDRDDRGCRLVLCAGVDDSGYRWAYADRIGTSRARSHPERDADAFEGGPWRDHRLGRSGSGGKSNADGTGGPLGWSEHGC